MLSKHFSSPAAATIHLVLNSSELLNSYGIDLNNFDFNQPNYPLLDTSIKNMEYEAAFFFLILLVLVIAVVVFMIARVKELIKIWSVDNFKNLKALDSLYRYQLDCIFTGKQPHNSSILSESAMSNFYEELSELIDGTYTSLTVRDVEPDREEPFKFVLLLDRVRGKYQEELKKQQEERNR